MLTFWYNLPRHFKFAAVIAVCALIYLASQIQSLSPSYTLLSLALGFGLHISQHLQTKISNSNPYQQGFKILFGIYPIMITIILITMLPTQNKSALGIQAFGFVLLGFFLVSIYQNRAKRF